MTRGDASGFVGSETRVAVIAVVIVVVVVVVADPVFRAGEILRTEIRDATASRLFLPTQQ